MSENEEQSIVSVARAIVKGEESILVGSRKLWSLWSGITVDHWSDEDFRIFGVIDSDIDDLLLASNRSDWDSESLQNRDADIRKREDYYRKDVLISCKRLIDRFGEHS